MTVSSTTNRSGPYLGNGVTTTFDYDFRILQDSHITVVGTVAGVDAIADPSSYSVAGVGDAGGGSITFTLPPAVGRSITIIRNAPFVQETDLENQGAYYAETVEEALDLAVMRDQQLEERLDRAVQIPVGANPAELPALIENVIRLSESAGNIDTVADNIDAVNELAPFAETITENLADIHNFADVYQGAKAIDPTLRNDGSSLQVGDLYFNTATDQMRVYIGDEWNDASAQALNVNAKSFAGNGVQTEFSLDLAPAVAANVLVWVGGARQVPISDYTVSGSTLIFAVAPANTLNIDTVVIATTSALNNPAYGTSVWPVSSIAGLKSLDTGKGSAYLSALGREGVFVWRSGDYSTLVLADTRNGIVVKSDAIPASSGAWVRSFAPRATYSVDWWGTERDGVTDESVAFNVARSVVSLLGGGWIEASAASYFMAGTVTGADGVFWRGQGWTRTRILRTGSYGDTFAQTGGGVRIEGFYFYHSTMPTEGATSIANRLTDGTAHVRLISTQDAMIEKNLFWRMPYGVVNDGGHNTRVYDNWFRGIWNETYTAAQEGIADLAFIGTNRYGQLAKVKGNYFSGTYNGTRSFTFTDGTSNSVQTIGWNVGSQNAIFAVSIEDIEISGNYFGRAARSLIRFALTSSVYSLLVDVRISQNFFDNAGNGYAHITTEAAATGKSILGMSIVGNTLNGEYDTYAGLIINQNSADSAPTVYNIAVTGNNFFAFVGTPIRVDGARHGVISGNSISAFNCFGIATAAGVNINFKAGVLISGPSSGILVEGNAIGGGGNTADPSNGNFCYEGVLLADATKGNAERNNHLTLKGADGNPKVGFSGGANFRTITANGPIYSSERVVFVTPPGAAMAVSLPANPVRGQEITVKDTGTAATHNVQVIPGTGTTTIDGAASQMINTNYGVRRYICTGGNWLSI